MHRPHGAARWARRPPQRRAVSAAIEAHLKGCLPSAEAARLGALSDRNAAPLFSVPAAPPFPSLAARAAAGLAAAAAADGAAVGRLLAAELPGTSGAASGSAFTDARLFSPYWASKAAASVGLGRWAAAPPGAARLAFHPAGNPAAGPRFSFALGGADDAPKVVSAVKFHPHLPLAVSVVAGSRAVVVHHRAGA